MRAAGRYGSSSLAWLLGLGLVDVGGDALSASCSGRPDPRVTRLNQHRASFGCPT